MKRPDKYPFCTCGHATFAHRGSNPQPDGQEHKTSCDLCLCKTLVERE